MIRSMTGFGRASFELEGAHFDVEVRTLNHRYLDVSVRLPRFLASHEADAISGSAFTIDGGTMALSSGFSAPRGN